MRRLLFLLFITPSCLAQSTETLKTAGLQKPVEIIRDRWGINHIYARNEHDLFFAQGYSAAQDRLFQLELWRRQATGTVAELLGPSHIKRDMGTRLFRFRQTVPGSSIDRELNHYHPHGSLIVRAFVDGVNAYVRQALKTPETLPFEFKTLHTTPGFWTPEVVISRHQGLLGNVRDELNNGRLVQLIGAQKLRELSWFHPTTEVNEPDLALHVTGDELFQPILETYEAFRLPLKFSKNDKRPGATDEEEAVNWFDTEKQYVGSNNWVLAGSKSASGYPMLANDPHRAQSTPSLRYWVHLNAPGWNVVGAGEPTLPGVSIGHNDYGAWGLTIFETDNEDLYVYETNPKNPNLYKYRGNWVPMKTLTETIPVKGASIVKAELKYTRHGPVVFEDTVNHKAYAVRAGWLEPGCAPYLASLRMNQAKNWAEFREACTFSRIPGENMIWGDKKGTIGWQAVGISPIRKNWTGLVPVPGDGRYEWAGYLSIKQLPNKLNPAEGYVVTANNNLIEPSNRPPEFPNRNAIGWVWASPSRAQRIEEVLANGQRKNLVDLMKLQADYLSIPARTLVPLLANLSSTDSRTEQALSYLRRWDYQLAPESVAASIYVAWEGALKQAVYEQSVPPNARRYLKSLPSKRVIDWLVTPGPTMGTNPVEARDQLLLTCLTKAVSDLTNRLGDNPDDWNYGQRKNKHITLTHPLSELVGEEQRQKINLGPLPRGGYGETVNATGNELNQTHGASFRILVDTENWDKTLGINAPGQSGNPDSPHYRDLFELWGQNGYFPVYFSRDNVKAAGEKTTLLTP